MTTRISRTNFNNSVKQANLIYRKIREIKQDHIFENSKFSLIAKGMAISLHSDLFSGCIYIQKMRNAFKITFAFRQVNSTYTQTSFSIYTLLCELLSQSS